eukprot:6082622-Pleurochrysis_carterae.AAC.2
MRRISKAVTHQKKERTKWQFEIVVRKIEGLHFVAAEATSIHILRQAKAVCTKQAELRNGSARWNETVTLVSTLYAKKGGTFLDKVRLV